MKTKTAFIAMALVVSAVLASSIALAHGMQSGAMKMEGSHQCPMMNGGMSGGHGQMHKQMHEGPSMHGGMGSEQMKQMHKLHHGE